MLNDQLVKELSEKLYLLRDERAENSLKADDLNDLIADIMNGLETLFIMINAPMLQQTTPQRPTFVSVSEPTKPKGI